MSKTQGPLNLRILLLLLCLDLTSAFAAEPTDKPAPAPAKAESLSRRDPTLVAPGAGATNSQAAVDDLILLERKPRSLAIEAVPDEGAIARLTANVLARVHYLRRPLNDEISSKFLDRYLDTLDGLHMHFLKSDLEEFDQYRTVLDDLTVAGKTGPARDIFKRFMQRVEQRITFVAELLKSEKFDLTGDDRYPLDRRKAAHPKDLDEAKQLWRQHLRYEYLEEKLNLEKPKVLGAGKAHAKDGAGDTNAAPESLHDQIITTLSHRYSRVLRFWREEDGGDVLQFYLTALMNVYDPHSDYLGKSTFDNFAMSMNLSLFGIGALLQSEDGYCKIKELKPGPALRSKKLKPGDRIVGVAQEVGDPVDVVDMPLKKVVELIRGPKDTKVRLTIIPADAADPSTRQEVALVRDEIKLEDEEAKARIVELPDQAGATTRLGVIDLPSFYASFDVANGNGKSAHKSTTEDVAKLLKKLKGEKTAGVILDLRHNGGGSLEEAINLTGLFIKEGPVVQVKDADGNIIKDEDTDPSVLYDGPLIVLTSRFSASASEIVAGALQDYGRALIVGDSATHGKGTVQSLIQLEPYVHRFGDSTNNPGALKVTIRKFYRASGSSTQLKGVVPDVVLPSLNNYRELGEVSLENPLPWDEIPGAKYEKLNLIQPLLLELRKRSGGRVAADKDFVYLQEDIETYKKYLADKSVSLNEAARLKEIKENEERIEARKKERKARHEPEEKLYELTLKQVDLPGLPQPLAKTNDLSKAESSKNPVASEDDGETAVEDKIAVDITLKEAKRILLDLIALSRGETAVAVHN
jgi:carboxyl-terminal processing protease